MRTVDLLSVKSYFSLQRNCIGIRFVACRSSFQELCFICFSCIVFDSPSGVTYSIFVFLSFPPEISAAISSRLFSPLLFLRFWLGYCLFFLSHLFLFFLFSSSLSFSFSCSEYFVVFFCLAPKDQLSGSLMLSFDVCVMQALVCFSFYFRLWSL